MEQVIHNTADCSLTVSGADAALAAKQSDSGLLKVLPLVLE